MELHTSGQNFSQLQNQNQASSPMKTNTDLEHLGVPSEVILQPMHNNSSIKSPKKQDVSLRRGSKQRNDKKAAKI